jgi:mono/diheme cytochrome c family protein
MIRLGLLAASAAAVLVSGAALAAGSPAAGKKVFLSNGCGSCHTFKPAGTKGTIGPALTRARLAADAKRAKQSYTTFIRTSIVLPKKYVASGYKPVMPSYAKLSRKQLDDLVAFVAKG